MSTLCRKRLGTSQTVANTQISVRNGILIFNTPSTYYNISHNYSFTWYCNIHQNQLIFNLIKTLHNIQIILSPHLATSVRMCSGGLNFSVKINLLDAQCNILPSHRRISLAFSMRGFEAPPAGPFRSCSALCTRCWMLVAHPQVFWLSRWEQKSHTHAQAS